MMLVLGLILLCGAAPSAPSPTASGYSAQEVKAALIYNVAKVTRWPEPTLENRPSFVIGVLGDDEFASVVQEVLGAREIQGMPIVLQRAGSPAELRGAQVVVIGDAAPATIREYLASLQGTPVLTVGHGERFCRAGGMVGFTRSRGKVRLVINREEAARHGIGFSSQLLKLARIVRTGGED